MSKRRAAAWPTSTSGGLGGRHTIAGTGGGGDGGGSGWSGGRSGGRSGGDGSGSGGGGGAAVSENAR